MKRNLTKDKGGTPAKPQDEQKKKTGAKETSQKVSTMCQEEERSQKMLVPCFGENNNFFKFHEALSKKALKDNALSGCTWRT